MRLTDTIDFALSLSLSLSLCLSLFLPSRTLSLSLSNLSARFCADDDEDEEDADDHHNNDDRSIAQDAELEPILETKECVVETQVQDVLWLFFLFYSRFGGMSVSRTLRTPGDEGTIRRRKRMDGKSDPITGGR